MIHGTLKEILLVKYGHPELAQKAHVKQNGPIGVNPNGKIGTYRLAQSGQNESSYFYQIITLLTAFIFN